MVIDAFMFYNELDLLEIRLNILDKRVDKFVIVEATETFSGLPKHLFFEENKERFAKWKDKIVHYVVDNNDQALWEYSKKSPNVGAGEHWWVREFYQKESMMKALGFCKNDDIVFISDLDEIWNPDLEIKIKEGEVYKPLQTAYHFFLNNRSNQGVGGWVGTHFGLFSTIKKYGINHFRTEREVISIKIPNGGWHFTFMGGAQSVRNKIESYGHQEYNNETIKSRIENSLVNNHDFLNRGFSLWKDESEWPQYLKDNKEKWKKLLA